MEAVKAQSDASLNKVMDSMKARVTTRAFGLRLGPISVDYTFKQMEVDPGENSAQNQASPQSQQNPRQTQMASPQSNHPNPTWRRGLTAYAQAQAQAAQISDKATLLVV